MEGHRAPYSTREVAQMSLDTRYGRASVVQLCLVFSVSRAAYYQARKPRTVALAVVADTPLSPPAPEASRKAPEVAVAPSRARFALRTEGNPSCIPGCRAADIRVKSTQLWT